jgi:hypothetical protein
MSPSTGRTRPNVKMLALGGAFLLPPGWIVFNGMSNLSGMPTLLALLTVGSLAVTAIALVFLALQNLESGDVRDASWQLGAAGVVILAEFLGQWWFAATENHAPVTALVMSMLSLGGALILEGEIMRVWKANARSTGQMSLARARVPREITREFPIVARIANRLAVRYPNATQRSVLDMAFAEADAAEKALEASRAAEPVTPRQVRVDVRELVTPGQPEAVSGQPEVMSGQRPAVTGQQNGKSEHADEVVRTLVPLPGQVAEVVRELVADGSERDDVVRALTERWPGVKADTVRRAYDRATSA